jgi:hypothetical protein
MQRVDLVQQSRALLDQHVATVNQRGQLALGLRFQARFGQHVLRQEEGQRAGVVPARLLDRLADHLELLGVDHHNAADAEPDRAAEPGAVAGRLNRNLVVAVEAETP